MIFSKTCEYALRAVLYLALNSNGKEKKGIKEIAEEMDLPPHFLSKIFQNLARHNIVQSVKGPNGGFYLDERSLATPVIRIVEITDTLEPFKRCGLGLKQCSDKHPCPIHHEFRPYRDALHKLLSQKTIAELATVIEEGNAFLVNG